MCPHEEKLTAWLLGDLSPEERQTMARHLDACAACRSALGELSAVLTPLRSGLAKDRCLAAGSQPARPPKVRAPFRLWFTRQDRLRRAALFAAAFGTLFALLSTVYRQASEDRRGDSPVTHITFQRNEPPAPTLSPATVPPPAAAAGLAELQPDALHAPPPAPIVTPPALPEAEPNMPSLRKLIAAKEKAAASDAVPAAAPAAPAPYAADRQAAKAVARRERGNKAAPSTVTRPPANLQMKSGSLAARAAPVIVTAPTNAVPTNAVPAKPLPPSGAAP